MRLCRSCRARYRAAGAMDDRFYDYDADLDRVHEFDLSIEDLIEEEIDRAKRRPPRPSEQLAAGQKDEIRRLANAIANAIGHSTRRRGSRRGRHQVGVARRALAIERRYLREIDTGRSYENVLAVLQRELDRRRFDEGLDEFDTALDEAYAF